MSLIMVEKDNVLNGFISNRQDSLNIYLEVNEGIKDSGIYLYIYNVDNGRTELIKKIDKLELQGFEGKFITRETVDYKSPKKYKVIVSFEDIENSGDKSNLLWFPRYDKEDVIKTTGQYKNTKITEEKKFESVAREISCEYDASERSHCDRDVTMEKSCKYDASERSHCDRDVTMEKSCEYDASERSHCDRDVTMEKSCEYDASEISHCDRDVTMENKNRDELFFDNIELITPYSLVRKDFDGDTELIMYNMSFSDFMKCKDSSRACNICNAVVNIFYRYTYNSEFLICCCKRKKDNEIVRVAVGIKATEENRILNQLKTLKYIKLGDGRNSGYWIYMQNI